MKVRVIGIDLGKAVSHLIGMDEHVSIALKQTFLPIPAIAVSCEYSGLIGWHGSEVWMPLYWTKASGLRA